MNRSPPWSRMRWHQPDSRTGCPMSVSRKAPQVWVRYRCMARPEENRARTSTCAASLVKDTENGNRPRFQSPLTTGKPASCEQSLDRLCRIAVGEYVGGQHLILDTEMVLEQALEHGAQIGRRFQIAVLVEIGLLDAG